MLHRPMYYYLQFNGTIDRHFFFFVFQDKPWIFAHLLQLQRRQGRDAFPLIEQTFFPNARDLVSE